MTAAMWRSAGRIFLWLVFLVILGEVTARLYLFLALGASPVRPDNAIAHYYPELRVVAGKNIGPGDGTVDVLLLGASALHPRWSPVASILAEWLTLETGREVRIHNLAGEGHTSLDSLIKYRRLADKSFDLVVFYHGINEARANNAPPDVFDSAYEHYGWYRKVNVLDRDRWLPWLALPAAARHVTRVILEALTGGPPVSGYLPPAAWLQYGSDVRSAEARTRGLLRPEVPRTSARLQSASVAHRDLGHARERGEGRRRSQRGRAPHGRRVLRGAPGRPGQADAAGQDLLQRRLPPDRCGFGGLRGKPHGDPARRRAR